jgi:hypothetical protein
MLSFICDVCGEGRVHFSESKTFESYNTPIVFVLEDLPNLTDGVLSDLLVFRCNVCDAEYRMTYKELDKKLRKELAKRYIAMCIGTGAKNPNAATYHDRVMIYCGKCNGFDGKGACPVFIYDTCNIKRLPVCDQIL